MRRRVPPLRSRRVRQAVIISRKAPAYTLKSADLVLERLSDLTMISLRSLFARPGPDGLPYGEDDTLELEREPVRVRDRWGDLLNDRRTQVADPELQDAPPSSAPEAEQLDLDDDADAVPWLYGGGGGGGGVRRTGGSGGASAE
jgi:hypothetical protein